MTLLRLLPNEASPTLDDLFYLLGAPGTVPVDRAVEGTAVATMLAGAPAFSAEYAAKPAAPSFVRYVSTAGDDANDGLSRGSAFLTLAAAIADVQAESGTTRPVSVYYVEPGVYEVSDALVVYARQSIVATAGPGPGNTVAQQGVVIKAAAGFTDPAVIVSESWTNDAEYCHGTMLDGITIDGNKAAGNTCHGVALNGLGEESMLRRSRAINCGGIGWFLAGTHAVGHLDDISAWDNDGGAYYFGPQPDGVANGGEALPGASGSVRCLGISGDGNAEFFVKVDGYYTIDIFGIKYEKRIDAGDACILITDAATVADLGLPAATGGARAAVRISGRADPAAGGGITAGDFVRIEGTAAPIVQIEACQAANWTNVINDTVASFVLPVVGARNVGFTYYCDDGNDRFRVVSRTAKMPFTDLFDYQATGYHLRGRDLADAVSLWEMLNDGTLKLPVVTGLSSSAGLTLGVTGDTGELRASRHLTISDTRNLVFSQTTGTKVPTQANQKMGFWGATPIVQPTAVADATDAGSAITQLNALLAALRSAGLIAT